MATTAIGRDEQIQEVPRAQPFDPRTEVSADAKYLVRQLVAWFLGVPLVIALAIYAMSRIAQ